MDEGLCDKPATMRVNNWPNWSLFWCPEHAELFREPHPIFPDDIDVPTFQRRER